MTGPLKMHYPGTQAKITAPFYVMACGCGLRMWSVLGEVTPCPKCGRIMQREAEGSHETCVT